MPDRVEVQDLTCPAGTTAAAPVKDDLDGVVNCQVVRLTIRIPPGHAGLTGLALGYGQNAVLPRTQGRYISGDDEVIVYDVSNYDAGPQWQAFMINLDTIPHSWEVRAEVDELHGPLAVPEVRPIDPGELEAFGSAAVGAGG